MEELFKQTIERLNKHKKTTSIGVVTAIEGNTCTVERVGLPPLLDVRLNAVQGTFEHHLNIIPKIGSQVLCLEVENMPSETCVVAFTEIQSVDIEIDKAIFKVEGGKIQLKNQNADLKLLLTELLTELRNAVVQTPSGVGNFAPSVKAKLQELDNKVNQLFN